MLEPGDWVDEEGGPRWWWKYVFPAPSQFWAAIIASNATRLVGAEDSAWAERVAAPALESAAIVHAAARVGDPAVSARLRKEAAGKLMGAVKALQESGI